MMTLEHYSSHMHHVINIQRILDFCCLINLDDYELYIIWCRALANSFFKKELVGGFLHYSTAHQFHKFVKIQAETTAVAATAMTYKF